MLEAIELKSEGSLIDAELIVKAKNLGFVIQQLGLDYFPRTRGSSTLSSPAVILKIFRELVTLYPEMRHPRRRDRPAATAETAAPEPFEAPTRGPLRPLVVTADDVGLHPGLTPGALKAHDEGIVTACSVVANGRALDDADRAPARPPGASTLGVHLTFVGERPLSPPAQVPSLLGRGRRLPPGFRAFAVRYLLGRDRAGRDRGGAAPPDREAPRRRPPARPRQQPPAPARPAADLRDRPPPRRGVPHPLRPRPARPRGRPLSPRGLEIGVLNRIGRRARRRLERTAIRTTDRTVGILDAGRLTPERLARILEDVEGTTELVCHPGIGDAALAAAYGWGYGWERETAALCDPGVRRGVSGGGSRSVASKGWVDRPEGAGSEQPGVSTPGGDRRRGPPSTASPPAPPTAPYSRSTFTRAASRALHRSWRAAGSVATAGSSTAAWAAARLFSASRIFASIRSHSSFSL